MNERATDELLAFGTLPRTCHLSDTLQLLDDIGAIAQCRILRGPTGQKQGRKTTADTDRKEPISEQETTGINSGMTLGYG